MFEAPLWEILVRGSAVYLLVAVLLRLLPKRQMGSIAPNDMIALVIVGSLAADAIMGDIKAAADILLLIVVILAWDYLSNLAEYHFPRFRGVAQDSPTLLVYQGVRLRENLRKETLTEQELAASLRMQGIDEIAQVQQAILEVDDQISVVAKQQDAR
ncbi:DUF421 domain-containing protein [Pseudomonas saudiphocaensis]|uniref:DUF421 domain-containing protein n=1 Tax=Pseudomonas saudiphocaensis TaxID=1499686 RepID=UPI00187D66A7|nr:YetF domain-containing protein [Pseudomonas saudiphocaensis]MBE7927590.1 DUF421 domain-containing protein [Pseudomonas saudiphocaensis]